MTGEVGGARPSLLPFALVATFWGVNYPLVVLGLSFAPPLWLALLRTLFGLAGALALLPVLTSSGFVARRKRLPWKKRALAAVLGVPNFALFFGLWMLAAWAVPAGQASVIIYTFPLWVLLLSWPGLSERPSARQALASLVGFGGVALLGLAGARTWMGGWTPFLELLGAALSWAGATVLIRQRFAKEEMLEANTWQLAGAVGPLFLLALLFEGSGLVEWTGELLGILLWVGVLGTSVAYALWFLLLYRAPVARVSAYLFVVPLVALAAGFLLLGQGVGPIQGVGIAAALVSIYLTHTGRTVRPFPHEKVEDPSEGAPTATGLGRS